MKTLQELQALFNIKLPYIASISDFNSDLVEVFCADTGEQIKGKIIQYADSYSGYYVHLELDALGFPGRPIIVHEKIIIKRQDLKSGEWIDCTYYSIPDRESI